MTIYIVDIETLFDFFQLDKILNSNFNSIMNMRNPEYDFDYIFILIHKLFNKNSSCKIREIEDNMQI